MDASAWVPESPTLDRLVASAPDCRGKPAYDEAFAGLVADLRVAVTAT
jgi:hypothetical protein